MITEGYLVRHCQGRRGGRGPALIDIAQDHLLFRLADQGLFDLGIALKGVRRSASCGQATPAGSPRDSEPLPGTRCEALLQPLPRRAARLYGPLSMRVRAPRPSSVLRQVTDSEPSCADRISPPLKAPWTKYAEGRRLPRGHYADCRIIVRPPNPKSRRIPYEHRNPIETSASALRRRNSGCQGSSCRGRVEQP